MAGWIVALLYGIACACGLISMSLGREAVRIARQRYDSIGRARREAFDISWSGVFLRPLLKFLGHGIVLAILFIVAITVLYRPLSAVQSVFSAAAGCLTTIAFLARMVLLERGEHPKATKRRMLHGIVICSIAMPLLLAVGALAHRVLP